MALKREGENQTGRATSTVRVPIHLNVSASSKHLDINYFRCSNFQTFYGSPVNFRNPGDRLHKMLLLFLAHLAVALVGD